jgi:PAS domain S-box-containing protein
VHTLAESTGTGGPATDENAGPEHPAFEHPALDGPALEEPAREQPAAEHFVLEQSAPEPLAAVAQSVDLASIAPTAEALRRARDTGEVAVTAPFTLVSDSALPAANRQLGLALYMPIYAGLEGPVPATVEARRAAIIGWSATALRADSWLSAVLVDQPGVQVSARDTTGAPAGPGVGAADEVAFAQYPATATTPPADDRRVRSAGSRPDGPHATRTALFGGRQWTLSFTSGSGASANGTDHQEQRALTVGGVFASILLASLVWVLGRSEAKALRLVEKTTATLRERESGLRLLADNASDLIARCGRDGRIRYASPSWTAELGHRPEQLLGRTILDLLHPDDHARVVAEVAGARRRGDDELSVVARLRGRDGGWRWFDARCRTVRDGSGVVETQVALRDVTARQRAEDELHDSLRREQAMVERLRVAHQAKSEFVSSVSHELRTPLTNVLGYVEMLADGDGGELNTDQARMLEVVDRNTRRLLALIEDLLTMSRLESDRLHLACAPLDVADVVRAACESVALHLRGRALDLQVEPGSDGSAVGVRVVGDAEQLERVLVNLLTNAVKFTPDGGRISVCTAVSGGEVEISVADTGIGIPADEQPRLFERFFRSSVARDRAIQGTGLGLVIARGIVEHHAGRLGLTSTPGEGTVVSVFLPLAERAAPVVAR